MIRNRLTPRRSVTMIFDIFELKRTKQETEGAFRYGGTFRLFYGSTGIPISSTPLKKTH